MYMYLYVGEAQEHGLHPVVPPLMNVQKVVEHFQGLADLKWDPPETLKP